MDYRMKIATGALGVFLTGGLGGYFMGAARAKPTEVQNVDLNGDRRPDLLMQDRRGTTTAYIKNGNGKFVPSDKYFETLRTNTYNQNAQNTKAAEDHIRSVNDTIAQYARRDKKK